ncbi:NAD-dependent epimerase/dehydratase family protein [Aneurinibacillus aneurinilyticus]|uniref:NAD-dependent epimerase/dehydratase family protein n=1 Tax=Aneurinibacillus aneurinilyticus TaxID=1391 RepID=UPI0023F6DB47|nr:NAD-dependent epimerase/dehydratase family protein [Aneurinibacillus aneurinilyticus]MCI1693487.1 NAD-dependent epimerase/dehydratase family protein [Aneurinibacillus aneurinilyticus]
MATNKSVKRPTVAIAGASGFVGRALLDRLLRDYRVIGLTRDGERSEIAVAEGALDLEWRRADLFSLPEIENGLQGVEYAFYLVHSMMPSARLTQGEFQDMDVILADNFARAARKAGVKQIIYLGGLIPEDADELCGYLHSRFEVEQTLRSYEVPVTALRTGLVVGANSSSFCVIPQLIRSLPVMICPSWMSSKTHPIALQDVVELLVACIGRKKVYGQSLNVGGPDTLTYNEMILEAARIMGKKCRLYPVPLSIPTISSLWITSVTGISHKLVRPLVGSLTHSLVAGRRWLQEETEISGLTFEQSARIALEEKRTRRKKANAYSCISNVRSVQRLMLPEGRSAAWTGKNYVQWLSHNLRPFIKVEEVGGRLHFLLFGIKKPLLELTYSAERSTEEHILYYITGGLLAHDDNILRRGRLEFREVLNGQYVMVAIHEFIPRLPWLLYRMTQALAHLWVMHRYGRYLRRKAERSNVKKEARVKG